VRWAHYERDHPQRLRGTLIKNASLNLTKHKKKLKELGPVSNKPLDANAKNSIFINDVGLYSLTLSSQKPEAQDFMD
jgi:prophage antirepressor-like protein